MPHVTRVGCGTCLCVHVTGVGCGTCLGVHVTRVWVWHMTLCPWTRVGGVVNVYKSM